MGALVPNNMAKRFSPTSVTKFNTGKLNRGFPKIKGFNAAGKSLRSRVSGKQGRR